MNLEEIYIYRMTHIKNIPHILEYGITHKNSLNSNQNFITIGDLSLIATRNLKQVKIDNGEPLHVNSVNITLGDYIPFYFGKKMPMLYVMQNGGNFVAKATPANDIVYLACSLNLIIHSNINYYFADGHATDGLTSFYDCTKINELPNIIDWQLVNAPYWGGQDNLNIKRKKQAEFLIPNDLESRFITGFGCYNSVATKELLVMGIDSEKIKETPDAYF
jgi:prepilin-type processing-associated H-X9-DG protein